MVKLTGIADCSAETLFGENPDQLLKIPYGYITKHCGNGLYLKQAFYGLRNDPLEDNSQKARFEDKWGARTVMALVRWLDGSAVAVRYRERDIHLLRHGEEMPKFVSG